MSTTTTTTDVAPHVAIATMVDGAAASIQMPRLGFGTYKFKPGTGIARKAVTDACRAGYRLIDTAFVYGGEKTEPEVGLALKAVFKGTKGGGGGGGEDEGSEGESEGEGEGGGEGGGGGGGGGSIPEASLVGSRVAKKFGKKLYRGKVTSFDGGLFHVVYSDGDEEDVDKAELDEILVSKASSSKSSSSNRPSSCSSAPAAALVRSDVFVVSKHWRAYHGYEPTLKCLELSLKRLSVEYLDLWLMHWPGPAYHTMARSKAVIDAAEDGAFVYAREGHQRHQIRDLRAETWRGMEEALRQGKVRAIGVSNMTVAHLEALKETATIWPPAVNQVQHESLVRRQRRRLF